MSFVLEIDEVEPHEKKIPVERKRSTHKPITAHGSVKTTTSLIDDEDSLKMNETGKDEIEFLEEVSKDTIHQLKELFGSSYEKDPLFYVRMTREPFWNPATIKKLRERFGTAFDADPLFYIIEFGPYVTAH